MIVRILNDNTVKVVKGIAPEQEDEFLQQNPNGFMKVDSLPESRFGYYKYNPSTKQIVVDEEKEMEAYKQHLIERANEVIQEYILSHYPLEKQNADNQQKDYYGTAILMIRMNKTSSTPLTLDHIYLEVGEKVNKFFNGYSFDQLVSEYPDDERFYWEQLLKAGIRKAWVVKCVYVFNDFKQKVMSAKSLDELEQLDVQILDFPEFPL